MTSVSRQAFSSLKTSASKPYCRPTSSLVKKEAAAFWPILRSEKELFWTALCNSVLVCVLGMNDYNWTSVTCMVSTGNSNSIEDEGSCQQCVHFHSHFPFLLPTPEDCLAFLLSITLPLFSKCDVSRRSGSPSQLVTAEAVTASMEAIFTNVTGTEMDF